MTTSISDKFLQNSLQWATTAMQGHALNAANEAFKQFFFSEMTMGAFHDTASKVKTLEAKYAEVIQKQLPPSSPAPSTVQPSTHAQAPPPLAVSVTPYTNTQLRTL